MNVLFVAPRFPHPPLQGDRLRAFELLRRLSARHTVTLVAPDAPGAEQHAAALCTHWEPVRISRWQALGGLAAALPGGLPLQVAYLCPPALRARARALQARGGFDLVHIHTARAAPAITRGTPAIVDLIDALSLNMRRRAARERGPARWLFALEAARMGRYEQRLLAECAGATVVAEPDRAALGNHPHVHVVPMGVDLERLPYRDGGRDLATLVFSGRMAYFPNADAACFLATDVMPLVRARLPAAQLLIVGADPPAGVRRLARLSGVSVTGYVPEIAPFLHRATVAVAPLRSGTGQQIKVLEAMACGAPVVATPHALAGIAARAGEHALRAGGAEDLADAIVQLLEDAALRQRLSQAARHLVEQQYSWAQAADTFDALYQAAGRSAALPVIVQKPGAMSGARSERLI
jgi:sugar transferase (PEP-CTERM/EpsH1 system associated)